MSKHSTLEYIHDEEGVTIEARPNGAERNNYWVKEVAYISFNDEKIQFNDTVMSLEMMQEISRHLEELSDMHKRYLEHLKGEEE